MCARPAQPPIHRRHRHSCSPRPCTPHASLHALACSRLRAGPVHPLHTASTPLAVASEKAWAVSSGELFEPVTQRGLLSNAVFVMVTAFFGAINLTAYAVELPFLAARYLVGGRAAA